MYMAFCSELRMYDTLTSGIHFSYLFSELPKVVAASGCTNLISKSKTFAFKKLLFRGKDIIQMQIFPLIFPFSINFSKI